MYDFFAGKYSRNFIARRPGLVKIEVGLVANSMQVARRASPKKIPTAYITRSAYNKHTPVSGTLNIHQLVMSR